MVYFIRNLKKNSILSETKKTYSAAWEKDIPANDGDNVSVYISHPVPENTYLDYEVENILFYSNSPCK